MSNSNTKELNIMLYSGVIEQVSKRKCSVHLILDSRENVGANYNSQQIKLDSKWQWQTVSELEIRMLNITTKVTLQDSYETQVCKKMVIERHVTFLQPSHNSAKPYQQRKTEIGRNKRFEILSV
jgi:hypothetical protein